MSEEDLAQEERVEEEESEIPSAALDNVIYQILHISNIPSDVKNTIYSLHNKDVALGYLSNREIAAILYYADALNEWLSWFEGKATLDGVQSLISSFLRLSRSRYGFQQRIFVDLAGRGRVSNAGDKRSIFKRIFG